MDYIGTEFTQVLRKYSDKTAARDLVRELESYGGDPANLVHSGMPPPRRPFQTNLSTEQVLSQGRQTRTHLALTDKAREPSIALHRLYIMLELTWGLSARVASQKKKKQPMTRQRI